VIGLKILELPKNLPYRHKPRIAALNDDAVLTAISVDELKEVPGHASEMNTETKVVVTGFY
jgi:hypothetical protein